MTNRFEFHEQLFQTLDQLLSAFLQQDPDHDPESLAETSSLLASVRQVLAEQGDYQLLGQQLLCKLISHYPALTPHIPRDLLWFFGGDCLHYLADEEIDRFQQLEDKAFETGENQDYADLRAQIFGLH